MKYGIPLLTNQKRKEEMVRAIEYLISRLHLTILTSLGPLVLFLFDNCDSDEIALSTLSIAVSVINDLNSTGSDQTIINVFGDEVTEVSVIADLYKLFFVILTPFFVPTRDEFISKIFDKFESSGGSAITHASIMTAKILLYFTPENVEEAKKFFIGKYGKTTTFNLKQLNNVIKHNILKTKQMNDNITMDMVETLPKFIKHYKTLLKTNSAPKINFSYDYNVYASSGAPRARPQNCNACTEKEQFMKFFTKVANNIFYMFGAMEEYEKGQGAFDTTLSGHNFERLLIGTDCKCKSLDFLNERNEQVGQYILGLQIKKFDLNDAHMKNTKALAYIMNHVVIPNNQLRQTPEKRVFKITREMWVEFLTKQKVSYATGGIYSGLPDNASDGIYSGLPDNASDGRPEPEVSKFASSFAVNPSFRRPLPSTPGGDTGVAPTQSARSNVWNPGHRPEPDVSELAWSYAANPYFRGPSDTGDSSDHDNGYMTLGEPLYSIPKDK